MWFLIQSYFGVRVSVCVARSVVDIADSSLTSASHKWVSLLSPQAESRCYLKSYWRSRRNWQRFCQRKVIEKWKRLSFYLALCLRLETNILSCFVCGFTVALGNIGTPSAVTLSAPLRKQKWNRWQDNAADSPRNAGSTTFWQLRIYTAVSPSSRKLTPPLGMQTAPTPLQWHGCACYVPCVCVVTQGHFGRVTGSLLNPPCVAVVHLPEVTPATAFFSLSPLRSASQQAASNCYIFLLAGVDSPYNIQRCCLAVNCGRCCKLAGAAEWCEKVGTWTFSFVAAKRGKGGPPQKKNRT